MIFLKKIEIEQKYRIKNLSEIRYKLKKLKAKKIIGGIETNELLDSGKFLEKKKTILRLRKIGKKDGSLTLKGPRMRGEFTKRMELETCVKFEEAKSILKFLGFKVRARYKKKREILRIGQTLITLDFLPRFGWFLEIEGSVKDNYFFEKKLNLKPLDREKRSYLEMLFGWKD